MPFRPLPDGESLSLNIALPCAMRVERFTKDNLTILREKTIVGVSPGGTIRCCIAK
jgi:hypothetical protein